MRLATWHSSRALELNPDLDCLELLNVDAALEHMRNSGALLVELEDATRVLYCLDRGGSQLLTADPEADITQWSKLKTGEPSDVADWFRWLLNPHELFEPDVRDSERELVRVPGGRELEGELEGRELLRAQALELIDRAIDANSRRENIAFALALGWRFALTLVLIPAMPAGWLLELLKGGRHE